jgi:hypothetical protein
MVQLKITPVESKNLFSRHYLEERLIEMPEWKGLKDHIRVFEEIKEIYFKEKSELEKYDEKQLEVHFIMKILKKLGHVFEVQQASDWGRLTPDYAFFSDEVSRRDAQQQKGNRAFYKKVLAVGDAKKWGTPLDRKATGKGKYEFTNPSFQIDVYLRDTGVNWGILTDGRYWRLYYKETSSRLDSYYQVDLASIIESIAKSESKYDTKYADFKYFYLFFCREAFLRDETGKNFLEKVYAQGLSYAKKIGKDLEKNVYKALKILGQGFLNWPGNNLTPTAETIKEIHDNSLILLYRLLFILYADSRGTLDDLHKPENAYYDINKIKALALMRKQDRVLSEHSPELWDRLSALFQLIDEGSEARGISKDALFVPPYNGGLFHSEERPFLAEKKVGDKYVADVLELLTVSPDGDIAGFIDYSTLEIRHLGSIYEGLLEYKLRVADKNMVAIKQKGKEVWIPKEETDGKKVIDTAKAGGLYLVTDKGERKATGSYYTPDYIVKYLVENTLGPVVKEKLNGATTDEDKIERILSIKVLDPAMGSGHFLVEATDFLAEKLVKYVKPEQLDEEKEIDWARREVVKHCIYGVDLNPLATELAKLSLWLSTLEASRPLSFLDHHLKIGNSLIGADLQKLGKHPAEVKGATAPTFISDFMDKDVQDKIDILVDMQGTIMRMAQGTIQDIKNVEALFKQFESNPFRQAFVELANLHTSYWLGNEFSKEEYYEALEAFRQFSKDQSKWEKLREKEYFKKAQQIAKEKNFYHWSLEFPEVFFEPSKDTENPGFDAVIGNPPYISVENLEFDQRNKEALLGYLSENYYSINKRSDISNLFIEKGSNFISNKGIYGQIVPNRFLTNVSGEALKDYLEKRSKLRILIDFGENKVFDQADAYTAILLFSGSLDRDFYYYYKFPPLHSNTKIQRYLQNIDNLFQKNSLKKMWNLYSDETQVIGNKISSISIPLKKIAIANQGIKTGFDKIFVLSKVKEENSKTILKTFDGKEYKFESDIIKPLLSNTEIKPYYILFHDNHIIYPYYNNKIIPEDVLKEKYPLTYSYLLKNMSKLASRKSLTKTALWYSLIRKRDQEIFENPKILTPDTANKSSYYFDDESYYYVGGLGIRLRDSNINPYFILSVLNSSISFWIIRNISRSIPGEYFSFEKKYTMKLPIRRVSFTTPKEERSKLIEELKSLYSDGNFEAILAKTEECLPKDKNGNFITTKEKSDVVHDLLAFLAEQMIEMNKEKNREIKGFLEWLEGYTKLKVDDMALKSKVREYYKHDWEEMRRILARNKGKIREFDVTRRAPQEKIRQEYKDSMAKLKPLLDRINETDGLIDQIVYKLYGLVEEEIEIVKGED